MKTYNISYVDPNSGSPFMKSCHIQADNPISGLLLFYKEHPGAIFHGMKLND